MENQTTILSCEELSAQNKEKAIIKGKDKEKNEEDYEEITDSDEEGVDPQDLPEHIFVDVDTARKLVRCELCLGNIRKTNMIKACTHRFCGECIDKWLKLGNKECPICGADCPSHHAVVEDLRFDKIVAELLDGANETEAQDSKVGKEDKSCTDHQDKNTPEQSAPGLSEENLNAVTARVAAIICKQRQKGSQKPPRNPGNK